MSPPRSRSWTGPTRRGSTSSTRPTSTAARPARAPPRRSSAAGSPRAATAGSARSWPPSSTATWATGRTRGGSRPSTSAGPATPPYSACRPTTSTSTRCTTSTGAPPWDEIWEAMEVLRNQGKILYVGSSNFAGLAHRQGAGGGGPAPLPGPGQRAVDLQPLGPHGSSRRCCRPRWTTASASSRGRPCKAGCSVAWCARSARGVGATQGQVGASPGEAPAAARAVRGPLRGDRPGAGHGGPGLAAHPAGGHGAHHRPPHAGPVRWLPSTRSNSPWTTKSLTRLDQIFPGHKTAPEDYAW